VLYFFCLSTIEGYISLYISYISLYKYNSDLQNKKNFELYILFYSNINSTNSNKFKVKMGNSYSKFKNNNNQEAEIKTFGDINLRGIIFSYLKDPPPPNFDFGLKYGGSLVVEYFDNWIKNLNNRGYNICGYSEVAPLYNKVHREAEIGMCSTKKPQSGESVNYPKNHWEKQKYIAIDIIRHIFYQKVLIHQDLPYSWSISDT
jgi:hypothetical protein